MNQSPVDENVEAPDDAGDGDHVEGDATAELPPLHAGHVKLLPLGQGLHLGNLTLCITFTNNIDHEVFLLLLEEYKSPI